MHYAIRLFVVPALAAGVVLFMIWILRIDIPSYDKNWAIAFLSAIPFVLTFFSQLHRIDVLRRLDWLESEVRRMDLRAAAEIEFRPGSHDE